MRLYSYSDQQGFALILSTLGTLLFLTFIFTISHQRIRLRSEVFTNVLLASGFEQTIFLENKGEGLPLPRWSKLRDHAEVRKEIAFYNQRYDNENQPLIISGEHQAAQYIVSRANITLKELTLKEVVASQVFIISAGDIEIQRIEVRASEGVEIFLYSALGTVEIGLMSENISTCEQPKENSEAILGAASRGGAVIRGKGLGRTAGCRIKKDQQYWAEEKLVGERQIFANHLK